jgi:hypothetical protein
LSFSAEVIDEYPSPENEESKEQDAVSQTFSGRNWASIQGNSKCTLRHERSGYCSSHRKALVGLSAGFAKEIAALKDQRIDPSLRRETQDYLAAIKCAQDSVDRAWITLVKLKPKVAKLSKPR